MRLLALFALFTDKMTDFSILLYTSTNEIPTLSCTQSPNKVPFSGWALRFGHNRECPLEGGGGGGRVKLWPVHRSSQTLIFSLRDRRARFIWRLKIKTAGYQIAQKKKEEEKEEGRKTTLNRLNCEKSRRESSLRIIIPGVRNTA